MAIDHRGPHARLERFDVPSRHKDGDAPGVASAGALGGPAFWRSAWQVRRPQAPLYLVHAGRPTVPERRPVSPLRARIVSSPKTRSVTRPIRRERIATSTAPIGTRVHPTAGTGTWPRNGAPTLLRGSGSKPVRRLAIST